MEKCPLFWDQGFGIRAAGVSSRIWGNWLKNAIAAHLNRRQPTHQSPHPPGFCSGERYWKGSEMSKSLSDNLQGLGQLLQGLDQRGSWPARQQLSRIQRAWPQIVGQAVARQSQPTFIQMERQVLQVTVATPAWAQTLTFERLSILKKLNQQLGLGLTDIRFSAGSWNQRQRDQVAQSVNLQQQAWQSHPSWMQSPTPPPAPPQTPEEAFNRWAEQIKLRSQHHPTCPACGCPCPPGELKRWRCCALCAAKKLGSGGAPGTPPIFHPAPSPD